MSEEIPEEIARILLRGLIWCGHQITDDQRELAWAWVEQNRGYVEEMGQ